MRRAAALGGIAGPATFITAWAALGATKAGYSPIHDPISRLAAVDASTRWAMTGGLLALGAGVGLFARSLAEDQPGAAKAAMVTAVASVAIAVTPLESALGGNAHAAAAGLAYASLAAIPALAGRADLAAGHRSRGRLSLTVAGASGASLLASLVAAEHTGLWQRTGLTLGHLWIAARAVHLLRRPS
ncbi:MAG: DUF998 domain-containing protein [Acidimicrobiales bacterium]|nr:DUF998 domain-containing protein [Acidimicrobiales bacterium]